jgi:hypothetical protein
MNNRISEKAIGKIWNRLNADLTTSLGICLKNKKATKDTD